MDQVRHEEVQQAIREGRASLDTPGGARKVTRYRDGWATTSNGEWMDQRSFVVTLDDIKITPRRI